MGFNLLLFLLVIDGNNFFFFCLKNMLLTTGKYKSCDSKTFLNPKPWVLNVALVKSFIFSESLPSNYSHVRWVISKVCLTLTFLFPFLILKWRELVNFFFFYKSFHTLFHTYKTFLKVDKAWWTRKLGGN